jgi:hypothetical protein
VQLKQVLAYGVEGRLAELLREIAQPRGVWLRDVARPATCVNLLRKAGQSLLVLKLGRDLEEELSLLAQVSSLFPETVTVAIGATEHPQLAALAWDLGARYVLFPPQPVDKLVEVLKTALQN